MEAFKNSEGKIIVDTIIIGIKENAVWLSDIDGLIADGDHGINMNKGFTMCQEQIKDQNFYFSDALNRLGRILLMEIGGSMGPLYGTFFRTMAKSIKEKDLINLIDIRDMLSDGIEAIEKIGKAKRGDKTLIDTLAPSLDSLNESIKNNLSFKEAIVEMQKAAENGMNSTKDMIAKIGRASRLGERSRGVLDAGACSSYVIIKNMGDGILTLLS